MSKYGVLVARIQKELDQIESTVESANSQIEKAKRTGDRDYFQAVALSLQNFYMGAEQIFEEIAKQVDRHPQNVNVPSAGAGQCNSWHKRP